MDMQGDNRVVIIGISNWALDASKQNRAIHVSRDHLSQEDLKDTTNSISKKLGSTISNSSIDNLIAAYQNIIDKTNEKEDTENFYGLRDFYYLVK